MINMLWSKYRIKNHDLRLVSLARYSDPNLELDLKFSVESYSVCEITFSIPIQLRNTSISTNSNLGTPFKFSYY